MRKYLVYFFIVFLTACAGGEKSVKIIDTNLSDDMSVTDALIFEFNRELASDTLLNRWVEIDYLEISPEVAGTFMWTSPNKLLFSPEKHFTPATEYSVKVSKEVLNGKKYKLSGKLDYSFQTPGLKVEAVNAYWSKAVNQEGSAYLHYDILFNYDLDPNDVASLTEIEIDGKKQDIKLVSSEKGNKIVMYLPTIAAEDKELKSKVTIKKGLKINNDGLSLEENISQDIVVPSPYKLVIHGISAEHTGTEGRVTINTSQQVDASSVVKYISVNPTVQYKVEVYPQYILLTSEYFKVNQKYEITVHKGLPGSVGGTLKYKYNQDVSFGKMEPAIKFVNSKEKYVSALGSRNIEVAIINVPKVEIKVTKVYENNIINFLSNSGGGYYDYGYGYYDYYSYSRYHHVGDLGDVVYKKEVESKDLQRYGNHRLLKLDFEDKLKGYPGIYVISIKSPDDYYLKASKVVSVSDIGLIAKEGKNQITVFANSVKTTDALSGVKLKLIGKNNQILDKVETNAEGVAILSYNELPAENFKTAMITAEREGDYNFLPFNQTSISSSRFEVGGRYENPAGMEAYIYGDRDIYRPGEQMHITAIVRNDEWGTIGQVPVKVKIITPDGKEYKTLKKVLNEHGSFEADVQLSPSDRTGTYSVEVFTSNNVIIGSKRIKVEEFVPDRIKVDVALDKEEYKPGENINVDVEAINFFGPPAANRNYEVEMSTKNKYFYPKENRGYNYSIVGVETYFSRIHESGKTDEKGRAKQVFMIPMSYKNMGILQSDFYITVFDETGRPVNRKRRATIYTQDHFYGIKYDNYYAKAGKPVNIDLIAVDKNGKALSNITSSVKLIRHEYKTVLSKSGAYYKYRSEKIERELDSRVLNLDGPTVYSFTPELTGRYEIRVSDPSSNTYVSRTIWAYGWGSTRSTSFEVDNEGQIDFEFSADNYKVGDKAEVLMKAPFDGKILVTIENNKVLDHFYVNTEDRSAKFTLDIKDNFVPNVYLSATLIKPHKHSELPFTVAHGWAPVLVENPDNKLPVEIEAVEKSRSKTKQVVTIKTKPNCAVTVAAVDEGILQVTGFETPDPYSYFYRKRALGVRTYDIYPFLFPEPGTASGLSGGGGMDAEKRVNPLANNRIELVALWSGILKTDGRGEATFTMDIPQHSGSLRVMAVAYKDKAFGSEAQNMIIADPVVISTALPRFFSPGDTVLVPVMVSNTTDKSTKCKTSISVEGPVDVISGSSDSKTVEANNEKEFMFKLAVQGKLGQSKVTIKVDGMGETFEHVTNITVRPASPLQKVSGSGLIEAGKSISVTMDNSRFLPSSIDNQLVISRSPMVQFMDDLDYLVRYPYGCVEQTVSKAFPQLYFNDLSKLLLEDAEENVNVHHHVQAAINKLKLMQLYNGGLTYWPGRGEESWWGSVYAAHFLIEAKKTGYDVDEDVVDDLLKYLRIKLKDKQLVEYYYNGDQRRKIVPKTIPYSLYVLALAGKPEKAIMNYYKADLKDLSLDGKYLLAASYALIGSQKNYAEILPVAFEGEKSNNSFGGSFYSYARDEAIALNVLIEVDPNNSQIGIMEKHVSENLKTRRYLNTQERTFSFLALGKLAKEANKTKATAVVKVNGKEVGTFSGKTLTLNTDQLGGNAADISVQGDGRIYYFWETEGISKDGSYREEDNYLKVRKNFYDRYGNPVNDNVFRQNDLILVELSISKAYNNRIDNVVISDILPAGFEIENPRITELPAGMKWPNYRSGYDYMDVRDDRINFFVDVYGTNTKYYYYLVRAVSMGTFKMGPVGADAMYNGEYHSYNGGGEIKVLKKQ